MGMNSDPELHHFLSLAARRFRALADASRLHLLMTLKSQGELRVGELTDATGLSQPVVSKHLGLLRHAGLVQTRRDGTSILYSLRGTTVSTLCDTICQSLQDDHHHLSGALTAALGSDHKSKHPEPKGKSSTGTKAKAKPVPPPKTRSR